MKIIHIVVGRVNPDTLNGVSKIVHNMAVSEMEHGADVEVWGLVRKVEPRKRSYVLRQMPMTRLRITLGTELRTALQELPRDTWVQFHSVFTPEFPAIARMLRDRAICYGVTPHGAYAPGVFAKNSWKKKSYFHLREKEYLQHATLVHTMGESEIADVARLIPGTPTVMIPNAQDPIEARPIAVPQLTGRPLFGYLGRLALQQKGLDFLLEGFGAYKASGGSGELWLIGDGTDMTALRKLAAHFGVDGKVHFLGAKTGQEKFDIMAALDVFVHPSRWDGIPTACLEAAALGIPLMVSRETNLGQYVSQNRAGVELENTSAPGVTGALHHLEHLCYTNELRQLGCNARKLIHSEFSWSFHAKRFLEAIASAKSR